MRGRPRARVAPCKFCQKQFKRQEHLKRHERTHTNEKPFQCFCGRSFSRQDLLARHSRLSHEEQQANTTPPDSLDLCSSDTGPAIPPHHGFTPLTARQQVVPHHESDLNMRDAFPTPAYPVDPSYAQDEHPVSSGTVPHLPNHGPDVVAGGMDSRAVASNIHPLGGSMPVPMDSINVVPLRMGPGSEESSPQNLMDGTSLDRNFFWHDLSMIEDIFSSVFPGDNLTSVGLGGPPLETTPQETDASSYRSGADDRPLDREVLSGGMTLAQDWDDQNVTASGCSQPSAVVESANQPPASNKEQDLRISDEFISANDEPQSKPWIISSSVYVTLSDFALRHKGSLPERFVLPRRKTLSRYLEGYFRGYHPHQPFLHLPTTSPASMNPRLLLSLAAVGAFYRFEHPQGYELYFASRSLLMDHLEQLRSQNTHHLSKTFPHYAKLQAASRLGEPKPSPKSSPAPNFISALHTIQSLVILIQLTVWLDHPITQDGFAMTSQLAVLVREHLLSSEDTASDEDWERWSIMEARRRTMYAAYMVCNLLTISFNTPPVFNGYRQQRPSRPVPFKECLRQLLTKARLDDDIQVTAFGNYVLIHGLIQQLYYERMGSQCLRNPYASLPKPTIDCYNAALRAWQASWNTSQESTLDPASPHGPMGFNSTAILCLTHIALSVDLGGRHKLTSRDPEQLARPFTDNDNPVPLRSHHLEKAVLHCIYALGVPIRVGIAFVARTQTAYWSVQHTIASFECALLLTRWLQNVASQVQQAGYDSLKDSERKLLSMITNLIQETHFVDDLEENENDPRHIMQLAIAAVEVWAETCQGARVFEIVHVMGDTLTLVATILKERLSVGAVHREDD